MSLDRRDFLKTLAIGGAAAGLGPLASEPARAAFRSTRAPHKLRILMLGGTRFLGLHTVKVARSRGHDVTLFNRGQSNPHLFPDLVKLKGDRNDDLASIEQGEWDAVVDTSGYVPRIVKMSADLLASRVKQYVFISTISVFKDFNEVGLSEESAVGTLEDTTVEDITAETYGPLKALCEQAAEAALPGRTWNVRPGLIVGPNDRSDRFTYWPVRVQRGGEVLAPESRDEQVQFIDVRDLADFIVHGIEQNVMGLMNAVSPPGEMSMGELLDTCRKVSGSDASFTWVPTAFLDANEVHAWSDMPCWIPSGEEAGVGTIQVARALAAGMTFRPLSETVRDTLDWWACEPKERRNGELRAGLTPEREAEVLGAWRAVQGMQEDSLRKKYD